MLLKSVPIPQGPCGSFDLTEKKSKCITYSVYSAFFRGKERYKTQGKTAYKKCLLMALNSSTSNPSTSKQHSHKTRGDTSFLLLIYQCLYFLKESRLKWRQFFNYSFSSSFLGFSAEISNHFSSFPL